MRRLLCLLLLLLLPLTAYAQELIIEESTLPTSCLAVQLASHSGSTMTEQRVIETALQALRDHHPGHALPDSTFIAHANRVLLSNGHYAWVGSLFGQIDNMPIEAAVTLDDSTAAVLRYEENNIGWFRQTQAQWETLYGRYGTWPLEIQVMFDMLYSLEITHATMRDGFLPEYTAYEMALTASGLMSTRDTLHCERSLVIDPYTNDPTEQYVWMMTLCLGDRPLSQVNISAVDGYILDVFDLSGGVG